VTVESAACLGTGECLRCSVLLSDGAAGSRTYKLTGMDQAPRAAVISTLMQQSAIACSSSCSSPSPRLLISKQTPLILWRQASAVTPTHSTGTATGSKANESPQHYDCNTFYDFNYVVLPVGLPYDRHWMVVREENGKFLTQRQLPQLCQVRTGFAAKTQSKTMRNDSC
jgi:hypothetical protein